MEYVLKQLDRVLLLAIGLFLIPIMYFGIPASGKSKAPGWVLWFDEHAAIHAMWALPAEAGVAVLLIGGGSVW